MAAHRSGIAMTAWSDEIEDSTFKEFSRLTRVPAHHMYLAPASAHLLKDQIGVAVETSLHREYLAGAVAVQIKLIYEIDARKKAFGRRLISLEIYKVRYHY